MSVAQVSRENFDRLRSAAEDAGIGIVASASLGDRLRELMHESAREEMADLEYAVVIGIPLSAPVLETVKTAPTWTYYHHYRMVNIALDQAALRVAGTCESLGYKAFPVPASQILDWEKLLGHLSHREIGFLAGLGWRGRNNLLVNPRYGSQVRYATVLTDAPLPRGRADESDCGSCVECISACPVGAIRENPEDFDLDRCSAQLRRFSKEEKLNSLICGLCVRACPGKRHERRRS